MSRQVAIILDDEDLLIEEYKDEKGKSYYVGTSKRYQPYHAKSNDPVMCFFKFNIQLSEQKD
jgi:hypothetical protein